MGEVTDEGLGGVSNEGVGGVEQIGKAGVGDEGRWRREETEPLTVVSRKKSRC